MQFRRAANIPLAVVLVITGGCRVVVVGLATQKGANLSTNTSHLRSQDQVSSAVLRSGRENSRSTLSSEGHNRETCEPKGAYSCFASCFHVQTSNPKQRDKGLAPSRDGRRAAGVIDRAAAVQHSCLSHL